MELTNTANQSYWFVLREDQSNVIFSSNNFTIQNPQIAGAETRYVVNSNVGDSRFIQINEAPVEVQQEIFIQSEKEGIQTNKDDPIWDKSKVKLLLTLCLENKFRNVVRDEDLWHEISLLVGATPDECCRKYGNLKRTYLRLLKKKRSGKNIKWVHYNLCEEVFKYCNAESPANLEPWDDSNVRKLLKLYTENLTKLRSGTCRQRAIWSDIAEQLGTTRYNCYHKYKNLKRTYLNWLGRSRDTGKLSKWPYCVYFDRIFYNNPDPCSGPWNRNKIKQLIEAYMQRAHKFIDKSHQKKELWKEISNVVGETASNCDRKFRNLKQTYLRLKMKADSTGFTTKWCYYKNFEDIFEYGPGYSTVVNGVDNGGYLVCNQEENYIKRLLNFYIENKSKFRDPLTKKKHLWKTIAPHVGLTAAKCDKKFRSLKQTYMRLADKKRASGKVNTWPYFCYFEQIYDEPKQDSCKNVTSVSIDQNALTEIKRVVQNVQNRSDHDKFEKLVRVAEESNAIQRERNKILKALLHRK